MVFSEKNAAKPFEILHAKLRSVVVVVVVVAAVAEPSQTRKAGFAGKYFFTSSPQPVQIHRHSESLRTSLNSSYLVKVRHNFVNILLGSNTINLS